MNQLSITLLLFCLLDCNNQNKFLSKPFIATVEVSCKLRTDGGCTIYTNSELKFISENKVEIKLYKKFICTPKKIENVYKDLSIPIISFSSYHIRKDILFIDDFEYSPLKIMNDKLIYVKDRDTINFKVTK